MSFIVFWPNLTQIVYCRRGAKQFGEFQFLSPAGHQPEIQKGILVENQESEMWSIRGHITVTSMDEKLSFTVRSQNLYLMFAIKAHVTLHLLNQGDKSNHNWSHSNGNNLEDKMEMAESTGSCGRSTQSNEIEEERKMVFKVYVI